MLSFIVPAHNEEVCLPATLKAIHESARSADVDYEIVVANDASTDRTSEIARQLGARVIDVNNRQIAATRNAGARAALGDRFIFVDADTTINARAVKAVLREMDKGAKGGGGVVKIEGTVPLWVRLLEYAGYVPSKLTGFCGGAFMYCARDAFYATGGFNEKVFWAEEGFFGFALRQQGPFVIVWPRVLTSGRRLRTVSPRQFGRFFITMIFHPIKLLTDREAVKHIWYNSDRSNDNKSPTSIRAKIANAITFWIVLAMLTGPIMGFIPWSLTPRGTLLGEIRFLDAIFLVHIGLFLWPIAAILTFLLFRQRILREALRLAAVVAFCVWQAWGSTNGVIWMWTHFYRWANT
jgi:glycosyltransferase involved in cell wall biosynthesis